MPKTNFTKAEEALAEAIRKTTVAELLGETDILSGKQTSRRILMDRNPVIFALQHQLRKLRLMDSQAYKKLGLNRKELKDIFEKVAQLDDPTWKHVVELKAKVDAYMKEWLACHPEYSDEKLVEQERLRNKNKRFNTSERWLPVDDKP